MSLPVIDVPKYSTMLPSTGEKITYRPFLVREQKKLLVAVNDSPERQMATTEEVVNDCTFGRLNVARLPYFDVEYLFLQIRGRSVGETINMELTCGYCNNKQDAQLDITNIAVKKEENHNNKIDIGGDFILEMQYPTLSDIEVFRETPGADGVLHLIASSIAAIWKGEELFDAKDYSIEELLAFVDGLTPAQLDLLQVFFDTMPVLKHDLHFNCTACNKENTVELEGMQSFFA
jgi:hypothetical protein